MAKSALPKRLASRIRSAQQAVERARRDIFHDADDLAQQLARIQEFESDPVAFSDRYYRGHGPDSYPVQTNVERARASVARKRERQSSQIATLKAADERLATVEAEVLIEVMATKPSSGRVPWPRSLPSFELAKAAFMRSRASERARDAIEYQQYMAGIERDYEREMAAIEQAGAREDAAEARRWARLSREEQDAKREEVRPWFEALQRGEITVWDILAGTAKIAK